MVTSFSHYKDVTDWRAASMRLFVFYLSLGLVRVCEIELSHMGKNNWNPDLVCENALFLTMLDILCNALLSNFHPLNLHVFTSRMENTVDPDYYRLYLHVLSYLNLKHILTICNLDLFYSYIFFFATISSCTYYKNCQKIIIIMNFCYSMYHLYCISLYFFFWLIDLFL